MAEQIRTVRLGEPARTVALAWLDLDSGDAGVEEFTADEHGSPVYQSTTEIARPGPGFRPAPRPDAETAAGALLGPLGLAVITRAEAARLFRTAGFRIPADPPRWSRSALHAEEADAARWHPDPRSATRIQAFVAVLSPPEPPARRSLSTVDPASMGPAKFAIASLRVEPGNTGSLYEIARHLDGGPVLRGYSQSRLDVGTEPAVEAALRELGWRPVTRAEAARAMEADGYVLSEGNPRHVLHASEADEQAWHYSGRTTVARHLYAIRARDI